MIKKYNIALLPVLITSEIIKYANFFSEVANHYKLESESLPHITLYQFQAEETEILNIWEKTSKLLPTHSIQLEFKEVSYITFDDIIFWISLMPNQRNQLTKMHQIIADALNKPINQSYDPHMTLINSKNRKCENVVTDFLKFYSPISDKFILAIGECDAIGQFTKLIYKM